MPEPSTLADLANHATVTVPIAGKIAFGLGPSQSYAAAKRGDLPVIEVNGRMRVLVQPLLRQLGFVAEVSDAAA